MKPEEVMKKPEVQQLLLTAGIDLSRENVTTKNYFQNNISNWINQGHNLPKLKADLCGMLIRGLKNESARTNDENVKFMNKESINTLQDLQSKFSRQANMRVYGEVKLTPEAQREVALANANKRKMKVWGEVKLTPEAQREVALARAEQRRKIMKVYGEVKLTPEAQREVAIARAEKKTPESLVKKGPLIAFTKTESEILGKIGIPRAGVPRKEFLRSFYKDVAIASSGKSKDMWGEPGRKYNEAVNKYGRKVAALINKPGQPVSVARAKATVAQILRNESRIAQAPTQRVAPTRPAPKLGEACKYVLKTPSGNFKLTSSKPFNTLHISTLVAANNKTDFNRRMNGMGITSVENINSNRTFVAAVRGEVLPIDLVSANKAARDAERKRT